METCKNGCNYPTSVYGRKKEESPGVANCEVDCRSGLAYVDAYNAALIFSLMMLLYRTRRRHDMINELNRCKELVGACLRFNGDTKTINRVL